LTDIDLDRLREKLKERQQREREEVARRLSKDAKSCRCPNCIEEDIQAREEREDRLFDRWRGF
jgi:hypothetical protein